MNYIGREGTSLFQNVQLEAYFFVILYVLDEKKRHRLHFVCRFKDILCDSENIHCDRLKINPAISLN